MFIDSLLVFVVGAVDSVEKGIVPPALGTGYILKPVFSYRQRIKCHCGCGEMSDDFTHFFDTQRWAKNSFPPIGREKDIPPYIGGGL
jgi:hypothetical protein